MQRSGHTFEEYPWKPDYRDTVKLLQEKLMLFLRLKEKLRNNMARNKE